MPFLSRRFATSRLYSNVVDRISASSSRSREDLSVPPRSGASAIVGITSTSSSRSSLLTASLMASVMPSERLAARRRSRARTPAPCGLSKRPMANAAVGYTSHAALNARRSQAKGAWVETAGGKNSQSILHMFARRPHGLQLRDDGGSENFP
jgi:hypothetical protein